MSRFSVGSSISQLRLAGRLKVNGLARPTTPQARRRPMMNGLEPGFKNRLKLLSIWLFKEVGRADALTASSWICGGGRDYRIDRLIRPSLLTTMERPMISSKFNSFVLVWKICDSLFVLMNPTNPVGWVCRPVKGWVEMGTDLSKSSPVSRWIRTGLKTYVYWGPVDSQPLFSSPY